MSTTPKRTARNSKKAKPLVMVAAEDAQQPLPFVDILEADNVVTHYKQHPVSAIVRDLIASNVTPEDRAKKEVDIFYQTPAKKFEKDYDFLAQENLDDLDAH